jgi:hypothetical protein
LILSFADLAAPRFLSRKSPIPLWWARMRSERSFSRGAP